MHYRLISPLILIGLPWIITLILYILKGTDNLVDLDASLAGIFLLMLLFFFLASKIPLLLLPKYQRIVLGKADVDTIRLGAAIKCLALLWFLGSALDIGYSGGLPLLWALTGDAKNYTDFGIPSFHGLINSFYFALMGCLYLRFKLTGDRRYLFYSVLFGLWPIFMLGRGIMLTVIVQLGIIQIFYSGISVRKIFNLAAFALLVVVLFGLLGDFRGTENPFQGIVSPGYEDVFELLPSGFLWVYIYITSPLSNLAYNYADLVPVGEFYYNSVNLFPSFLRPEELDRADNFMFVNEALNVSTIFASSHSDFGMAGDVVLLLLLSLWAGFWFRRVTVCSAYILPYSLLGVVLFFSVFYNLFLLYPYLFSTVLLGVVARYVRN